MAHPWKFTCSGIGYTGIKVNGALIAYEQDSVHPGALVHVSVVHMVDPGDEIEYFHHTPGSPQAYRMEGPTYDDGDLIVGEVLDVEDAPVKLHDVVPLQLKP